MKEFFDIPAIRSRLESADVEPVTVQAYLTTLMNLNAISDLLSPHPEMEEEEGRPQLERLFQVHQRRKQQLELECPVLATVSRPTDWKFQ